jgi:hypothetical protein
MNDKLPTELQRSLAALGYIGDYAPDSNFIEGYVANTVVAPGREILKLNLQPDKPRIRCFGFVATALSGMGTATNDYLIRVELEFRRGGRVMHRRPMAIQSLPAGVVAEVNYNTTPITSWLVASNSAGSTDAILIKRGNSDNRYCLPKSLIGVCDEVVAICKDNRNTTTGAQFALDFYLGVEQS